MQPGFWRINSVQQAAMERGSTLFKLSEGTQGSGAKCADTPAVVFQCLLAWDGLLVTVLEGWKASPPSAKPLHTVSMSPHSYWTA